MSAGEGAVRVRRPVRWRRLVLLFGFFLVALLAFDAGLQEDGPADVSIEFLHYTTKRTARFRLLNASGGPVTFVGHGPAAPFHEVSLHLEDGWVARSSDQLGMAAGFHTVGIGATVLFEVPVVSAEAEWKVAVLCYRGAPRMVGVPDWLAWLPSRVIDWVRRRPRESGYVWSGLVPSYASVAGRGEGGGIPALQRDQ